MRLWSISPEYSDAKGLVALWRETFLAKHVLEGLIKSYKNYPQFDRFYAQKNPLHSIKAYLQEIYNESLTRGYKVNHEKIGEFNKSKIEKINISDKQKNMKKIKISLILIQLIYLI